jgi:hypothetical protein
LTELYLHGNPGLGIPEEVLGPTREVAIFLDAPTSNKQIQQILNFYFRIDER